MDYIHSKIKAATPNINFLSIVDKIDFQVHN